MKGQWIWKDFGDIGGTVIDFVVRYKSTDVIGALAFLEDRVGESKGVHLPFIVAEKSIRQLEREEIFTLLETKDFGLNSALSQYVISERCINKQIARQFLTEIYFVNN